MEAQQRSHWKNDLALLFVILVWGINFPIVKGALAAMHPHVMNAFRFMVSTLMLGTLYFFRPRAGRKQLGPMLRAYAPQIGGLGFLGYFLYQFCFIVGIDNTTAGTAALIMAGAPLWTAMISRFFGFERIARLAWIGLAAILAGTMLVVVADAREISLGSATFFGNLMMLGASVLWGAYTAFSRPVLSSLTPTELTFLSLLVALPLLFGIALPHVDEIEWARVDLWVWLAILFSGGLSTGLAVVIWNAAILEVGASHTAAFGNLVPLVAVLGSVLLLGERLTLPQILGGALILSGLLIMRRSRRPLPTDLSGNTPR